MHWWTAALVGVCAATSLALSVAPVATLVGRRALVKDIHVAAGLFLLVPLLVGRAGPWARQLKADLRLLDRFDAVDRHWLRSFGRHPFATSAKFHPGQKLNAALTAAALVSLFATGVVLRWFEPFPIGVRRGATFVHDWTAFLFAVLMIGHTLKALADGEAMRGMVRGDVDRTWAATHHPRWTEDEPQQTREQEQAR